MKASPNYDFFKIYTLKDGKFKIEFYELAIFEIIKDSGYYFTTTNNIGNFFKQENGKHQKIHFYEIKDAFTKYLIEYYKNTELLHGIEYVDFMNEYYKQNLISNKNKLKRFLEKS